MAKTSSKSDSMAENTDAQPIQEKPKTPTIGQLAQQLSDRLADVMNKTGKRPGSLVAFQNDLQEIIKNDHPLLHTNL